MGLEPIRQTTLSDTVVERLRDEIVAGRWRVGERIPPEQELMAQLGVARGTLREALRSLQYTGLIEIRRGDGTFVRSRSEMTGALSRSGAQLRDVVEAQLLIEPQIARLAAERATPEQITDIEEALAVRAAAIEDEAWLDADIAAHMAIAAAVDNPIYADLYAALLPYKRQGLAAAMHRDGMERNNHRGHEEVLEAIKRRDPAAAEASARANLEDSIVWDLVHEARERY